MHVSASLATQLTPTTARFRWLAASVSGQVKSQTMQRPLAQGRTVRPSGRLPSFRDKEFGSRIVGILAVANARLMRSLTALCRISRPADLRQESPCVPLLIIIMRDLRAKIRKLNQRHGQSLGEGKGGRYELGFEKVSFKLRFERTNRRCRS